MIMLKIDDSVEVLYDGQVYQGTVSITLPNRAIVFVPSLGTAVNVPLSNVKLVAKNPKGSKLTYRDYKGDVIPVDSGTELVFKEYRRVLEGFVKFRNNTSFPVWGTPKAPAGSNDSYWTSARAKQYYREDFPPNVSGFRTYLRAFQPRLLDVFNSEKGSYNSNSLSRMIAELNRNGCYWGGTK